MGMIHHFRYTQLRGSRDREKRFFHGAPLIGCIASARMDQDVVAETDRAAVERANGKPLSIVEEPRRAGDPPELVAVANRIHEVLGWSPQFDDLDTIVHTSLEWERKIAAHDSSAYWAA